MQKALLEIKDGVATITFNSPQNFNALDAVMVDELVAITREVDGTKGIRVVVLRGAGKAFCAGGDIAWFAQAGEGIHDTINALGPGIQHLVHWMRHTPAIVVAVVHGAVAGGGLGLMLAADVAIAAEEATFAIGYARLGTNPDAGASYFLARTLGYRRALELYLMSERLDGRRAQTLGLVNFTAPATSLQAEAETLIRRLAAGPAQAHAAAKRLFRQAPDTGLHQHLDDEIRLFSDNTRHPDFAEGVRAFLEKRPPKFA
ncbi:MAG: enoyl-CoA hydratase-related protein [Usitatibacteraceae bacterium]